MLYEIGSFCLDSGKRLLTRDGEPIPLPPKSFDLLLLLVESGGRALSKNELMQTLWPDTFVEEANLSFQVSSLRKILGEDGARWIETLPKHGYRFAGPAAPKAEATPVALAKTPSRPSHMRWYWAAAIAFGVGLYIIRAPHASKPPGRSLLAPIPLTAYVGIQSQPSLSPDGTQVAFSWNGPNEENFDIYVKLVGPGEPVRLTTDPSRETSPTWSPDGRQIAFIRYSTGFHAAIFLIPALGGGAERKLADLNFLVLRQRATLGWTPDGKYVAVGASFGASEPAGIWLISAETGERRNLTKSNTPLMVDYGPVFSPRGRSLAFIRATSFSSGDLYLQRLTDGFMPAGDPVPITSDHVRIESAAWVDNDRIVYATGLVRGLQRLRVTEIGARGATVTRTADFGEGAVDLTISRNGRLVYARQVEDTNVWRLELSAYGAAMPERIIASTLNDYTPAYSPDGRKIAFTSTRSGVEEIWVADSDGSHAVQVTSMGSGHTANPRWSLDGRTIVFNSWHPRSDLYLLDVGSGSVKQLSADPADEVEPSWSRDGKWIYCASNRTGRLEVYRLPAGGGPLTGLTHNGGGHAEESADQKWVYYAKDTNFPTAIWRVPVDGGEEERVLSGLTYTTNFAVIETGIYLLSPKQGRNGTTLEFYDFASGKRKTVTTFDKRHSVGIALSPDQRYLLYSIVDRESTNLMLVDGFR